MGLGIKGTFGEYVDFYADAWRGVRDGTAAVPYGGGWGRTNIFESTWRFGLCRRAAPLLGELSRKRLRGRRSLTTAIRQKKRQYKENHCHSP